jgi:hypothetical protein
VQTLALKPAKKPNARSVSGVDLKKSEPDALSVSNKKLQTADSPRDSRTNLTSTPSAAPAKLLTRVVKGLKMSSLFVSTSASTVARLSAKLSGSD